MKYICIGLLLTLSVMTSAQEYTFKVVVNKGDNEVKTSGGWQRIKVGASLASADELKVGENAYLGLVHASGKPLEVKKSGNYKVVDLAGRVGGGSSVLHKYTDFILSENSQKKNRLAATGAVHRGEHDVKVYLPKPELAHVYDTTFLISWDTTTVKGPYTVAFNSLYEDELTTIKTDQYFVTVNLNDAAFANEDNILVSISSADGNKTRELFSFKRLSKADKERIQTSMKEIYGPLSEETALNKLYIAGFFEGNKLLIDAASAYLEAMQLAPDVPAYREAYKDFLVRHGWK